MLRASWKSLIGPQGPAAALHVRDRARRRLRRLRRHAAEARGQFDQLLFIIYALLAMALVIAVLGALLGVAMGVVFGFALMASLRGEGLEVTVVPVVQLAVVVVGAGLFGVLAAVFPARRPARLDVLRAIAAD